MPRIKVGTQGEPAVTNRALAEELVQELKNGRKSGQPIIYEQEFSTGRMRVTVIWDKWEQLPLEDRSSLILRAFEIAEGPDYRDRIALASGLTVPEALAAGMLPYQVEPGLRKSDRVSREQVRAAMIAEGATELRNPPALVLAFATEEEALACRSRLSERLPESEPIWMILRSVSVTDSFGFEDKSNVSAD
jgi:hypothetical protein